MQALLTCIVVQLFMSAGVGGVLNFSGARKTALLTWSPDPLTQWFVFACSPDAQACYLLCANTYQIRGIVHPLKRLGRRELSRTYAIITSTASCCAGCADGISALTLTPYLLSFNSTSLENVLPQTLVTRVFGCHHLKLDGSLVSLSCLFSPSSPCS